MNRLSYRIYIVLILILSFADLKAQTDINEKCKSNIRINTDDSLSVILINGNYLNTGNNISFQLPQGNYSLVVIGNKYQWDSRVIHDTLIISNCDTSISLSYNTKNNNKIFVSSIPSNSNKIDLGLNYLGKESSPGFSETNLFKYLLGSAVVLGATAAYFKLKADDNFDQYKATNNKVYNDRTHKYDLISGVAFGALQINFGILIYHFLTD